MSLKEATLDLHQEAEQSPFAQLLLSGDINQEQYSIYLYNIHAIYEALEIELERAGLLDGIESIKRTELMKQDLDELGVEHAPIMFATAQYITYVAHFRFREDKDLLMAHMYVRHFGDLYGGQIVKSRVPGSGKMYEFEDRTGLIETVRSRLKDSYGDEARLAFRHALHLFEDLSIELNL